MGKNYLFWWRHVLLAVALGGPLQKSLRSPDVPLIFSGFLSNEEKETLHQLRKWQERT